MRKSFLRLFIICLISLPAVALAFPETNRSGESRSAGEFTVGIILPSFGEIAEISEATRRGTEFAAAEHPTLLEDVRFVFAESAAANGGAEAAYKKLRETHGANVVYAIGDSASKTVAPLAEADQVPLFVATSAEDAGAGKHFVIRSHIAEGQVAETLGAFLAVKGYRKLAVVQNNQPATNRLIVDLRRRLKPSQNLDVAGVFSVEEEDFRSTIIKIRSGGYDAIGVFLSPSQLPIFYKQLREFRFFAPTFGSDSFENSAVVERAEGLMDGAVFAQMSISEKFRNRFNKRYGSDSQIMFAAKAYDFAVLTGSVARAISRNPSAEELLKAFALHPEQTGVVGSYSYVERDGVGKAYVFPVVMKMVQGNRIKQLTGKF